MRNYNLFRRVDRDQLICAVPEDRPVPSFIADPPWGFAGRVQESSIGPMSFNHEAAEASVRWNGFYLFQLINLSSLQLETCQSQAAETVDDAPAGEKELCQKALAHRSEVRRAPTRVRLKLEVGMSFGNWVSPLPSPLDDPELRLATK